MRGIAIVAIAIAILARESAAFFTLTPHGCNLQIGPPVKHARRTSRTCMQMQQEEGTSEDQPTALGQDQRSSFLGTKNFVRSNPHPAYNTNSLACPSLPPLLCYLSVCTKEWYILVCHLKVTRTYQSALIIFYGLPAPGIHLNSYIYCCMFVFPNLPNTMLYPLSLPPPPSQVPDGGDWFQKTKDASDRINNDPLSPLKSTTTVKRSSSGVLQHKIMLATSNALTLHVSTSHLF